MGTAGSVDKNKVLTSFVQLRLLKGLGRTVFITTVLPHGQDLPTLVTILS